LGLTLLRKRIVEFLGLEPLIYWLRKRTNRDNVNATATAVLAFATIALTVVAVLQWRTFEKTDLTLRSQQRAFVFLDGIQMVKHPSDVWYFVTSFRNNGLTQTRNLVIRLACGPNTKTVSKHALLGPRQVNGEGACTWTSDALSVQWKSREPVTIQGDATYDDIFGDPHLTRYCRQITIDSDPHSPDGVLQQVTAECSAWPDCADKECQRTPTNLPEPK
jgi:hypothetical protein